MNRYCMGLLVLNLWAASQNPAIAQLFTQPANATGNLQRVGMDSGTITRYQLMRLQYIVPGQQSQRGMIRWASVRSPADLTATRLTTRYPYAVAPDVELFRLADQPETCVRLLYRNGVYQNSNFVSCPVLEDR